MASLNLSSDGPAIAKSYQSIVNAPLPTGAAASSQTYGQWAVYSVAAPLVSAFQQDSAKESTLRVQSTGEGELVDLIDEFSDGRIQFAFVKVKDPNTTLPKSVLIAWCGEGVPERTKGYFTSHLAAVAKLLHGYHVQVTARTDNDLTPESIIRKVADASGSKYSGDTAPAPSSGGPPPPVASKPVFTPTQMGGGSRGFNPLGARSRAPVQSADVDEDGWGADAPRLTRTQLEKVTPAYQPTKVNMNELTSQKPEPSFSAPRDDSANGQSDVVKGAYQPVGKVDIAAIRRQAQESNTLKDDRPTIVKGSYEPVGKVDIAAIRARAQPSAAVAPPPPAAADEEESEPKSLADRSAAFTQSERISALPKPKVANKFGSGGSAFTGTKAPTPIGLDNKQVPTAAPVGLASRTFADEGGKTPAQIWAEKKARQRGSSGAAETARPMVSQTSGGGEWESGYVGKKWAPVQTTRTGQSATSPTAADEEPTTEEPGSPVGNVSAIRDRFKDAAPMGASHGSFGEQEEPAPPPMDLSSKPNARGVAIPGLARPADEEEDEQGRMPTPPAQPPRSPTPPTPPATTSSPIRIAQPVGRGQELEPVEEQFDPPAMPSRSMAQSIPQDMDDEPQAEHEDPARGASQAAAASSFGAAAASSADPTAKVGGKRALVQFDYEKAEDNELELVEGEYVTNIDMVDEDWWLGKNSRGESGLFPANYVEIVGDDESSAAAVAAPVAAPVAAAVAKAGPTATAEFDYEAAEDNELSFPEGATITEVEFPDEDWWLGIYNGKQGLFPANYVQLDQ